MMGSRGTDLGAVLHDLNHAARYAIHIMAMIEDSVAGCPLVVPLGAPRHRQPILTFDALRVRLRRLPG